MAKFKREKLGKLLEEEDAKKVIKSFRGKFLGVSNLPNWKGEKIPSWCNFVKDFRLNQVTLDVFDEDFFQSNEIYYIYFEFSKEIRLTTQNAIKNYFIQKPQWVNHDTYIFPLNLEWCVVNNHDDILMLFDKQL